MGSETAAILRGTMGASSERPIVRRPRTIRSNRHPEVPDGIEQASLTEFSAASKQRVEAEIQARDDFRRSATC